jgi:two-component system, NarL family, sensor histidine kinase UhpB
MSLGWRIFLVNAVVFVAGAKILILSPATIGSPATLTEAGILLAGVIALLLVNLALVWRSLAPLERLTALMDGVDLLRPKDRLKAEGPSEVRRIVAGFNDMLARLEEERRESGRRALAAQEGERKRVAQELHDEVGQSLTAVMLQVGRLAKRAPPDLAPELEEAQEEARGTLDEVRRLARDLRPDVLDDLGLTAALAALVTSFGERTGLRVERRFAAELPELHPDAELVLYRVAQESLSNVARHASASRVQLRLEGEGGGVRLRVRDDGQGLNGARPGSGILGMRERALLIGGDFAIESLARGGVEVRLEVPTGEQT